MNFLRNLRHDPIITLLLSILLISSLLLIFSATRNSTNVQEGAGTFSNQIIFILLGLIVYFSLNAFEIEWLKNIKVVGIIYLVIIGLLVYLLLFAPTIEGTKRWIEFGFFNLQPSEFAKLAIIILTSYIISNDQLIHILNSRFLIRRSDLIDSKKSLSKFEVSQKFKNTFYYFSLIFDDFIKLLVTFIYLIPVIALIFLQPALGNTLILTFIWFLLVFVSIKNQSLFLSFITFLILSPLFIFKAFSPLNLEYAGFSIILFSILSVNLLIFLKLTKFNLLSFILILIAIIIGISGFLSFRWGWNNLLKDYQKVRVESFIEGPESDKFGAGYQVTQSKLAIGSGQLDGRGYLQGSQVSLRLLDLAFTDFIFAALGEQFGFEGSIFILAIYLLIILRILHISTKTEDKFYSFLCIGIAIMILLNLFINSGMNMGVLPVTGVPLPFVSYGGTSILVNIIGIGLVQSIYNSISAERKFEAIGRESKLSSRKYIISDFNPDWIKSN